MVQGLKISILMQIKFKFNLKLQKVFSKSINSRRDVNILPEKCHNFLKKFKKHFSERLLVFKLNLKNILANNLKKTLTVSLQASKINILLHENSNFI
jgi:hypothetical protein